MTGSCSRMAALHIIQAREITAEKVEQAMKKFLLHFPPLLECCFRPPRYPRPRVAAFMSIGIGTLRRSLKESRRRRGFTARKARILTDYASGIRLGVWKRFLIDFTLPSTLGGSRAAAGLSIEAPSRWLLSPPAWR